MTSEFVRRIRGAAASAALLLVGGCAGAAGPAGAGTPAALPVGSTGGSTRGIGLEVTARNVGQEAVVPVAQGPTFEALEATFSALQIPLSRREPERFTIGNDGLKMRRKLGSMELRRLFDCGGTSGMPNSETYTITASIISAVTASASGGSVVTTVIDASAENPSFPGSGVRCSSTGSLEDAIAKELRTRLNAR
ncbi:MAG: hypothetical protein V4813_04190 [Gemmatimonadota bacterium]